jgi:hypothetical protein
MKRCIFEKISFMFKHLFTFLSIIVSLFQSEATCAQDVLTLFNGRKIYTKIVEVNNQSVIYKHFTNIKERNKSIMLVRIFSIESCGKEEVVYSPDPLDPELFTVEQMRMFIKGEQEAMRFYESTPTKIVSVVVGAASGYFGFFYGLIGPPLFTTIVGSFSPNMSKVKVTDPSLINDPDFTEGYAKKVRDYKVRKSILFGGIGYSIGLIGLIVYANN